MKQRMPHSFAQKCPGTKGQASFSGFRDAGEFLLPEHGHNVRMHLVEVGWAMWTGSVWLRIRAGGELL
jgi:hypothetical protein